LLIGDPSKARAKLGWTPKKTFDELVTDMVESDLELFKQETGRVNRHD
jgi:GDPmannose 4,6-dehydratase